MNENKKASKKQEKDKWVYFGRYECGNFITMTAELKCFAVFIKKIAKIVLSFFTEYLCLLASAYVCGFWDEN